MPRNPMSAVEFYFAFAIVLVALAVLAIFY